jgi:hypothetical protein
VLKTKAWSQNIRFKLSNLKKDDLKSLNININSFPSLVIFSNEKVFKIIE